MFTTQCNFGQNVDDTNHRVPNVDTQGHNNHTFFIKKIGVKTKTKDASGFRTKY